MKIIDMHVHLKNRSRCSNLRAEDMDNLIDGKVDAVCLTDHWLIKERKENPFKNLSVVYGVELDCELGDILAYGIKRLPLKKPNLNAEKVIKFIHDQEGIAVCAHPYSNRHQGFGDNIFNFQFDAVEINGSVDKRFHHLAQKAAEEMDIPLIGGSDAHSKLHLNTVATEFLIHVASIQDIIEAIKKKDCRPIIL